VTVAAAGGGALFAACGGVPTDAQALSKAVANSADNPDFRRGNAIS